MLPPMGPARPIQEELAARPHFLVAIAPARMRFPIEWVMIIVSEITDLVLELLTARARLQTFRCSAASVQA